LIEEAQRSLAGENLADFILSQDENGILRVENTKAKDILYTFIPDADNAIIVDTDKMPIGLSVGAGGFYNIPPQRFAITMAVSHTPLRLMLLKRLK